MKKGKVLTHVQYSNGGFGDLYCENIKMKPDDNKKTLTLSLDYSEEYHKRTWAKADFEDFLRFIDNLESISFNDKHATTNIKDYFKHSDKNDYDGKVELLIDKPYVLDAAFSISGTDKFEIKIKSFRD